LLNKHGEKNIWKFPGGDITAANDDLESWAAKKVQRRMGLTVKIIRPLKTNVILAGS
jgi:ADP-ribose pyrophosphatase YjhB (NUDIX family)